MCFSFFGFDPSLFEADVEAMPDVLWPNAKEILCSAVSRCTRYIALGLDDALVCVWDRLLGEKILWCCKVFYQNWPQSGLAIAIQFIRFSLNWNWIDSYVVEKATFKQFWKWKFTIWLSILPWTGQRSFIEIFLLSHFPHCANSISMKLNFDFVPFTSCFHQGCLRCVK